MAASIYDWSVTPSSNATADTDINWSEGMFPSVVNDSARQMMGRLAEYVGDNGVLSDSGTANVIKVMTNAAITSPPIGMTVAFKAAFSNTGAATLGLNGGAGLKLRKVFTGNSDATDLDAGDIVAKGVYVAHFDTGANAGAGAWILINPTNYVATAGSVINAVNKDTPSDTDSFVGVTAGSENTPASLFKTTWEKIKLSLATIFYSKTEVNNIVAGNMAGRAYPRRSDGAAFDLVSTNGFTAIETGQPPAVIGGGWNNQFQTFWAYNPANFSVNYATSAGDAATVGGWSTTTIQGQINAAYNQAAANIGVWTAGIALDGVGSYALMRLATGNEASAGEQRSGSLLSWASTDGVSQFNAIGTWRCQGSSLGTAGKVSVWKRMF